MENVARIPKFGTRVDKQEGLSYQGSLSEDVGGFSTSTIENVGKILLLETRDIREKATKITYLKEGTQFSIIGHDWELIDISIGENSHISIESEFDLDFFKEVFSTDNNSYLAILGKNIKSKIIAEKDIGTYEHYLEDFGELVNLKEDFAYELLKAKKEFKISFIKSANFSNYSTEKNKIEKINNEWGKILKCILDGNISDFYIEILNLSPIFAIYLKENLEILFDDGEVEKVKKYIEINELKTQKEQIGNRINELTYTVKYKVSEVGKLKKEKELLFDRIQLLNDGNQDQMNQNIDNISDRDEQFIEVANLYRIFDEIESKILTLEEEIEPLLPLVNDLFMEKSHLLNKILLIEGIINLK